MPWTDRFFPDYGYGLSPEIEAQLRRRGLMDFGVNLLSDPRFSQLGPALGQARQGYGESARDYAQFERQKRYDESIAGLRKSQVAENEAQARARERADEIALLSRESALSRLAKLAPDEVADYESEPASVIRERLRELRRASTKEDGGFDYRSGNAPIVRVDKVTGEVETIYTPPAKTEKPAKPMAPAKEKGLSYAQQVAEEYDRLLARYEAQHANASPGTPLPDWIKPSLKTVARESVQGRQGQESIEPEVQEAEDPEAILSAHPELSAQIATARNAGYDPGEIVAFLRRKGLL